MTRNVECIKEDTCLKNILFAFKTKKVSHLIVTNNLNEPTGIVSINDMNENLHSILKGTTGRHYTELELGSLDAQEVMTKNPVQLQETDSIEFATEIFLQGEFHALPVLKGKQLSGIVTNTDLLKAYYEKDNNLEGLLSAKS